MNFLNFGTSPTKSFSGHAQQHSNNELNVFGAASSGHLFGGNDDISGGSFFGGNGESQASLFGSTDLATPMKQEQRSGQGDDFTPPVKKQKPGTPRLETNPTSLPAAGNVKEPSKTSEDSKLMCGAGAPNFSGPSSVQGFPQFEEANKPRIEDPEFKVIDEVKTVGVPADELFKELLSMQRQQLSAMLPDLKEGEEKSDQVLESAMSILEEVTNYSEKLSGIKQQYSNRLNQVSSFLRMMPKPEN